MDKLLIVLGTKECPIRPIHAIIHKDVMIRKNWSQFVRGLGIPSNKIDKLRQDMQLDKITYDDLVVDVLEEYVSRQASDATLKGILKVVEEECQAIGVGENIRLHFQLPCKAADNNSSIEWDDLSLAYQNQVIKNFEIFFPNVEFSEALPKLKAAELVNLMTGKKPSIYRNTIPETPSYYIRRTLITRNLISSDIFAQNYPDIFLFKGVSRSELSKFAKDKVTTGSREQLNGVTIKFMILDQPNHFGKICRKTTLPVHLLEKESDGRLRWIRSKGNMNNLQRFMDHSQDELDEETFCNSLESWKMPVFISDSPGMGKTLLLARIGNFLSKTHPERSVVFIALTEFIKLVKQLEIDDKIKRLKTALQNYCGYEIFSGCKTQSEDGAISVELLVDGFDELDSSDYEFAYDIFKTIETSFLSSRLWVTSRPHHLEELERRLNVLGYNIRGFRLDDQIQFLSSYWSRNNPLDGNKCQQFAQHCLRSLKSKLKSEDQDIAGIPLQCLLIGEAYEDDAKEYAARTDNKSEDPMDIDTEIGTITNLYRHLINNKIRKYETTCTSTKLSEQEIMTIHVRLSLELIFPDFLEKTSNDLIHPVEENQMEDVLKVGILESESTVKRPRFLHRTFAEYFIACFLTDSITTIDEASSYVTELLFRTLETQNHSEMGYNSFKFSHPVIAYFINSLISEEHRFKVQPGFKEDIKKIIHACANANHFQTFKLFEGLKQFDGELKKVFRHGLLYLAIWNSRLELVTSVVTYMEQHNHFDLEVQAKSLSTAVKKGNVTVVEFLLKSKQLSVIVEGLETEILEIIHDCVEKSKNDLKIVEKVHILQMLIEIQPALLEKNGGLWKEKPLLCFGVHVQLLTELVGLEADVFARGIEGDTVLHMNYGRNHLSAQDYHELLLSIPEDKLKSLVTVKRDDGDTPLISILRWINPKPETLAIFKSVGANFNCVDRNDCTPLRIAIDQERSPDTIFQLIQCGGRMYKNSLQRVLLSLSRAVGVGKKEWKGTKGLLHHAVKNRNVEAVTILLEDNMVDVNALDEDGLTPLDHAVRNIAHGFWRGCYLICLALYERGGVFNDLFDSQDGGLIHAAVESGDIQSVTTLKRLGVDVNMVDTGGDSALHRAAKLASSSYIVEFLLENGANCGIENNAGKTPYQIALENENLEMFSLFKSQSEFKWTPVLDDLIVMSMKRAVNWLNEELFLLFVQHYISHVVEINYQNDTGNSLLHLAAQLSYDSVLAFLLTNGANVDLKNHEGQTPLHLATRIEKWSKKVAKLGIIKSLIEHGADAHAKDKQNRTFLHTYLSFEGDPPSPSDFHTIVQYLVEKDLSGIFNTTDELGRTPLHLAVQNQSLYPEENTLLLLHASHADFNAVDNKGCSVLTYAVKGGFGPGFLYALIARFGANPLHLPNDGQGMLHAAAFSSTVDVLKFFLDLDDTACEVNGQSNKGNTPLHCVLPPYLKVKQAFEKCQLLIERGADVNIMNETRFTPFDYAEMGYAGPNKTELLELLRPAYQKV